MNAIGCAQCGFENDLSRVFCQNCGAKLTRPEGAGRPNAAGAPAAVARPGAARKRRGMGLALSVGVTLRQIVFTAITGAILASMIQMVRAPDGIPSPDVPNEKAARALFTEITGAAAAPYLKLVEITPAAANNYLASRLVPSNEMGGSAFIPARFSRAFVVPREGVFHFVVQQNVLGHPIYTYLIEKPIVNPSGMASQAVGGGVGKMPLDPRLVPVLKLAIGPVSSAIGDILALLASADGVTITPKSAKVSWRGTGVVPPASPAR